MKIAIPSDEGTYISQHFGKASGFAIFEVNDRQILNREYRSNTFTGHALGQHHDHQDHGPEHEDHAQQSHNRILSALHDCEVVIAGGMGRRLVDDLTVAGKRIIITTQQETKKAAELFLADELQSDKESCSHHK
jgi:predicted Fe-Mo cluster-binding NifX family protein